MKLTGHYSTSKLPATFGHGGGSVRTVGDECICGVCRSCRLQMKLDASAEPLNAREPVVLGAIAQRILDEGAGVGPTAPIVIPSSGGAQRTTADRKRDKHAARVMDNHGHLVHPAGSGCPHGCATGYQYWGCRCGDCRAWACTDRNARRARNGRAS